MKIKKILLVSATQDEISPFLKQFHVIEEKGNLLKSTSAKIRIDSLITGLGIPFTVFQMTRLLSEESYDLIINAGIAGSFNEEYKIGEVFQVVEDSFGDLGVESNTDFETIFEAKLYAENKFPFNNGIIQNDKLINNPILGNLRRVKGITVNKVHGKENSIKKVVEKFNPDIETMEGAAFFYVCKQFNVLFLQLRSISNMVEVRDRDKWEIPLAIENLNAVLINLIGWFLIK